jgi:hypothetical protein
MNTADQSRSLSDHLIDSHRLITGLRHALDVNYARVLGAAKEQWERYFEANDPSNACVTVRVSSGKPTAAVIKKPAVSLLYGSHKSIV